MSADNYVVVAKFNEEDYRWGMFFASDDPQPYPAKSFTRGPFGTPEAAARDAENDLMIIEYGIRYEDVSPDVPLHIDAARRTACAIRGIFALLERDVAVAVDELGEGVEASVWVTEGSLPLMKAWVYLAFYPAGEDWTVSLYKPSGKDGGSKCRDLGRNWPLAAVSFVKAVLKAESQQATIKGICEAI